MKIFTSLYKLLLLILLILLVFSLSIYLSGPIGDLGQQIRSSTPFAEHTDEQYYLQNDSLTVPAVPGYSPHETEAIPDADSMMPPGFEIVSKYVHGTFYQDGTAVVEFLVENTGDTTIFVYSYGIELPPDNTFIGHDTGYTIKPGEEQLVGLVNVEVPPGDDELTLKPGLGVLAKSSSRGWYDYNVQFFEEFTVDVSPLPTVTNPDYRSNPPQLFSMTNLKVNSSSPSVRAVAAVPARKYAGAYNIYQVCALFDHTQDNINYISDPRGDDHWADPDETLMIGAGDCDDYAILLSSLIEAIGGTTRIYTTDTHAFCAVYVGDAGQSEDVAEAVQNYYGHVPIYYATDEYGSWLLLDPTSGLYAGDLPAGAVPTADGWEYVNTTTVNVIDILPE
ncbi:MAG: transglutaminase family protein [Methanosarcinaceae archaeon]|nr:transglutaminase family protein [Methanosarcinaceae archaeon]